MHGVTGYPLLLSSIIKVLLLIRFLISFKVASSQDFLTSAANLAYSEKFLDFDMKWDTSDTDSHKAVNELLNSLTTTLNNFCKPLPILFYDSYNTFHSLCVCLIRSRIFNLSYLVLIFRCT